MGRLYFLTLGLHLPVYFRKYTRLTSRNVEGRLEEADRKQGASSHEVLSILCEIQRKLQDNRTQLEEHSTQLDAQRQVGNRLVNGMYVLLNESEGLNSANTGK